MIDLFEALSANSLSSLITVAAFFFAFSRFVSQHLKQEVKDDVALWLMGSREADWHQLFIQLFDNIYGEYHFSLRCFLRSCMTSLISVSAVALAYAILNVADFNENIGSYAYIAILCVLINFIPDYLSLLQTRYLLKRLSRSPSTLASFGLLWIDLIVSLCIVGGYIGAILLLSPGIILNLLDVGGLFFLSIFVVSSLTTSLFSWLYFLSSSWLRLFRKSALRYFDVKNKPLESIALISGGLFLAISIPLSLSISLLDGSEFVAVEIQTLRANVEAAGFQRLDAKQLASIITAFVVFVWLTHSAIMQTTSSFLISQKEASWLIKSQVIFSLFAIFVVATKIALPTFWSEFFSGKPVEQSALAKLLIPSGLPKWQIASAINGVVSFYFWHLASSNSERYSNTSSAAQAPQPVFDHIGILRFGCAILSAYSVCAITYIALSIEWTLPPICEGFFPWSASQGRC